MCKSLGMLPCPDSSGCLHCRTQVDTTVHAEDVQWSSCDVCIEENKKCNCDHDHDSGTGRGGKDLKGTVFGEKDVHHKANSSFLHAVVNMIGMLIGLGQLSTPYALQNGGWTSAFLLVGLGIICAYSSHLLGKCLSHHPKSRNYADIGHQAFGSRGRIIAATFIYMEIFMALVSYTISLHDNLNTVFMGTHLKLTWPNLSTSQILTVMAVLVALPSLWLRDLSSISFLSTGGILMSILIFLTVAWTAVFGGINANHTIPALQIRNMPTTSGLFIFSFAGHIVFPNIQAGMKDPSKFTKVSIVGFTLVTMLYTSLAFMGAKMFGPEVNPQITLSMPRNSVVTKIALWATVLTPMTKYALEFAPFAMQMEHSLPHSMTSRTKMIIRGGVGSFLLLAILALALSVPYFEYVLSLTGSLVSVGICIIFPSAFYIKIFWGQISKPVLVINLVLIAIGAVFGVAGTISSMKFLIRSVQRGH